MQGAPLGHGEGGALNHPTVTDALRDHDIPGDRGVCVAGVDAYHRLPYRAMPETVYIFLL